VRFEISLIIVVGCDTENEQNCSNLHIIFILVKARPKNWPKVATQIEPHLALPCSSKPSLYLLTISKYTMNLIENVTSASCVAINVWFRAIPLKKVEGEFLFVDFQDPRTDLLYFRDPQTLFHYHPFPFLME